MFKQRRHVRLQAVLGWVRLVWRQVVRQSSPVPLILVVVRLNGGDRIVFPHSELMLLN